MGGGGWKQRYKEILEWDAKMEPIQSTENWWPGTEAKIFFWHFFLYILYSRLCTVLKVRALVILVKFAQRQADFRFSTPLTWIEIK